MVLSPQISRQHISPRCLLCAPSSALSDSALTCACMLMPLSPICQSAHSLMGEKNSVSTTGMQKVTAMALVKRLYTKPHQLHPTTQNAGGFSISLICHFPPVREGRGEEPHDIRVKIYSGYTQHDRTDSCSVFNLSLTSTIYFTLFERGTSCLLLMGKSS